MFNHRLIQICQCANEIAFIEKNLTHLLNVVDEVLVIPGMIRSRWGASPNGLPIDGTYEKVLELAEKYPKIRVVDQGWFESWETIKHAFLSHLKDKDWYLVLDADEFYNPEDLLKARKLIDKYPNMSEIIPIYIHYQWDTNWIINPPESCNITHQRFRKFRTGDSYLGAHPTAVDKLGRDSAFNKDYQKTRFVVPELHVYHYGHTKPLSELIEKSIWDRKVLGKLNDEDATKYGTYDAVQVFYDRLPGVVLSYDGYVPFPYGTPPDERIEPFKTQIKNWLQHPWYNLEEQIPQISGHPKEHWTYNTRHLEG
jgi:hypothetical protein